MTHLGEATQANQLAPMPSHAGSTDRDARGPLWASPGQPPHWLKNFRGSAQHFWATTRPTGVMHEDRAAAVDLDQWMVEHVDGLLRFAHLQCGSATTAQDLVQDVLVELIRRRDRLPVSEDLLPAYARRAIVNRINSVWRRRLVRRNHDARLVREASQEPGSGREESAEVADRVDLQRALAELPGRQRAALVLRFYEGYSHREVASALGCREATARSLVHRALAQLRATQFDTEEARA